MSSAGVFAMKGWQRMIPEAGASLQAPAFDCTVDFVASLPSKFPRVYATCYVEGHHLRRRPLPVSTSAEDASTNWWAVDEVKGTRVGIPLTELIAGIDVDVAKARAGAGALVANMVFSSNLFFAFRALATQRGLTIPIVPEVYIGNSRAEFDKRYHNEGFVAPVALRSAIEGAACDKDVQAIWVAHAVELCRRFQAGRVASIYCSAPKGQAAELFLSRCMLEGILKKQVYAPFAMPRLTRHSSAPPRMIGNPSIHQHYYLSTFAEGMCDSGDRGAGSAVGGGSGGDWQQIKPATALSSLPLAVARASTR